MFDIAAFKESFIEFKDFDDAAILFWAGIVENLINEARFGSALYQKMLCLGVAHYLKLSESGGGAAGGAGSGGRLIASKSVGGVSISYDNTSGQTENAGQFNETTYGKQFSQLLKLFGGGGVVV